MLRGVARPPNGPSFDPRAGRHRYAGGIYMDPNARPRVETLGGLPPIVRSAWGMAI